MTTKTKFQDMALDAYRGDNETYTFTITDADGDAVDLSTYTVKAQGRRTPDETLAAFDITIANTSPSNFALGIVVLVLPAATTALMDGTYYYDIEASKTGDKVTLARGLLTVTRDVTR